LGHRHTEETKASISASLQGNINSKTQPNAIKIEVNYLETNIYTEYNSIREAARALNCNDTSIVYNLRNLKQRPFKKRYIINKF
jgi:hypothetical protein